MPTYSIDGTPVRVDKVVQYALLGLPIYYKINEVLVPVDRELYFSETGHVIDRHNSDAAISQHFFTKDGVEVTTKFDFFALDSKSGIIFNNKLYFISDLESIN